MSPFTSVLKVVMQSKTNLHPGFLSGHKTLVPLSLHVCGNSQASMQSHSGTWLPSSCVVPWYCNTPVLQFYIRMCLNCRNQTLILSTFRPVDNLFLGCRVCHDDRRLQCSADLPKKKALECSNQQSQLRPICSFLLPIEK